MNINKENTPPLRKQFRARLTDLRLPAKTHPYLENWAESFMKAKAYHAAENTPAYFAASSRSAHLVLDRNVAPSTQKQALNALVFLHRAVFQHGEFIIQTPLAPREYQRPPTILSRPEVRELFGESSTRTSSRTNAPPSTSRALSSVNTPMPPASSRGAFSSRPPSFVLIPVPGNSPGIVSSKTPCSDSSKKPSAKPPSPSESPATLAGTVLQRTSSMPTPTSAPSKTSSVMPMSLPKIGNHAGRSLFRDRSPVGEPHSLSMS
jgi:hypothetical protein